MTPSFLIEVIERDLDHTGQDMLLLKEVREVGPLVPLDWTKYCPEIKDDFYKFMNGQTLTPSGYFVGDVLRFLRSKRQK